MTTTSNITDEQFDTINTHGWDLERDVEGFSVRRDTDHGGEIIHVNYRHDGDHLIQVLEGGDSVMPSQFCPEDGCLDFIEDYTRDHPAN